MWFMPAALATDLPTLATAEGHRAALEAVDALIATTKAKKLTSALDAAGLGRVEMPVVPFFGAELTLTATTPLTGCAWDGRLSCRFTATADAPIAEGEYAATCRSAMGSRVPVAVKVVAPGPTATFLVEDARPCWDLGRELLLHPVSDAALDTVGQGDEFAAPELTGLRKTQVEEEITKRNAEFRRCAARGGPNRAGTIVIEYHIGSNGRIDQASVASSTLGDAAVEGCLVDTMRKLAFPPPGDGYTGGTYPFTFQ